MEDFNQMGIFGLKFQSDGEQLNMGVSTEFFFCVL